MPFPPSYEERDVRYHMPTTDIAIFVSSLSASAAVGYTTATIAFRKYGDAGKALFVLSIGLLRASLGLSR